MARRPQWFDEHPAACTCVACNEGGARRRTRKRPGRKVPQGSRRREGEHPPTSDHPPACTCVACFKNLQRDLRSSKRALGDAEARISRGGRQPPVLRTRRGRRRPPGKRRAILIAAALLATIAIVAAAVYANDQNVQSQVDDFIGRLSGAAASPTEVSLDIEGRVQAAVATAQAPPSPAPDVQATTEAAIAATVEALRPNVH